MKTLILNLNFVPLSVVSAYRGIVLSMSNKNMSVLEYYDLTISSERDIFEVPAVMLYNKFVKPPKKRTVSKRFILLRDNNICQYCQKKLNVHTSSVDHVIPVSLFKSRAEANTWDNLVACCKNCNTKKGNLKPEEAGMKLIRQPRKPSGFLTVESGPEIWRKYVSSIHPSENCHKPTKAVN